MFSFAIIAQNVQFTADVTSGCAPLTVTFTNITPSYMDTTGVKFYWSFNINDYVEVFDSTYTYYAGYHNVSLNAFDQFGNHIGSYYMGISVEGNPGDFEISTGHIVCPGENIHFSGYGGSWNQFWDFGDGSTSNSWDGYHSFTNAGTYNVLLIADNSCGRDTTFEQIIVSDTVAPEVQFYSNGNDFCANDVISFNSRFKATNYLWDFGDGTFSANPNPEHSYSADGDYVVKLTVTNSCGMSNFTTNEVHIISGIVPYSDFNAWPNPACPNQEINFNIWNAGTCQWDLGDGFTSTSRNFYHAYADTGTYSIELILTNSCGNSDTTYRNINVQYQGGNTPSAYLYFENFENWGQYGPVDTITVCTNTLVLFMNASGGGDLTSSWDFGDGNTATTTNGENIFTIPGLFEVKLIVTNSCGGQDSASKWVMVNENLMPNVSISAFPVIVCPNEKVLFWDENFRETNQYTYSAWFGDGDSLVNFMLPTDTLFEALVSHSYTTSGTYYAFITVTNLCGNVDTVNFTITVDDTGTIQPQYFVSNSTINNNNGPIQFDDWSVSKGGPEQLITFPISFSQWQPGMNETMYLACWYGGISIFNGDPGSPDGIIEVHGADTVTVHAAISADSVVIAGIWYCNEPFQSDPDAFGILGAFSLVADGDTTVPDPGLVIANWSGVCDPPQSGNNPSSACIGDSVEFFVVGGESYEWHFGDGATATGLYATHTYSDTGFYDAFVKITNTCGTIDTVHTLVEIGNYNLPQNGNLSIDGRWTCANSPVSFQYYSDNGGYNSYNYVWSFGDGDTSTEENPVHYYSNSGQFIINLAVSNGCGTTNLIDTVYINSSGFEYFVSNGCFGENNGYIEQININYNSNVAYNWSTGQTTESIYNLASGDYTVTISGSDICTFIHTYTITANSQIDISFNVTNESCPGNNDGQAESVVTGGDSPYYYFWFDGSELNSIQNLTPGNYNITVLDANACSATNNVDVFAAVPLSSSIVSTNLNCYQSNNGTIDLTPTGGAAPYTYFWTCAYFTDTLEDLIDLPPGDFYVTITDNNGCTTNNSATLTMPTEIIMAYSISDAACGAANGAINLTTSGGISPYSFSWSNGATTEDLSGLSAGYYVITLSDANGCTRYNTYGVFNPGAPTINNIDITYVTCYGDSDGGIAITVSGGNTPYTYLWSNDSTGQSISNVAGGNYSITVTDASSCVVINPQINVYEPELISTDSTVTNVSCNGLSDGVIDINVNGGNGSNVFVWSNSETSNINSNLASGTYYFTVTDTKGCTYNDSAVVSEPDALTAILVATNNLCNADSTGSVDLTAIGGVSPYTYVWDNSSNSEDLNAISAGTYNVTVYDANMCSYIDAVTISEPSVIVSTLSGIDALCNGESNGSVDLTVSGGTSTYTYLWSNAVITEDLSNVPAGIYVVEITDANMCTKIDTFEVSEPDFLFADAVISDISCNGANDGSFDITIYGGVSPYTVLWSNDSITEDIYNLSAGYYSGTLTDANGCIFTGGDTIYEPAVLVLTPAVENNNCYGDINGIAYANPTGGTAPYYYVWSVAGNSNSIINLPAGDYYVTVNDVNGCSANSSVTITTPDSIAISYVVTNAATILSSDGAIDLTVIGGTASGIYSYIWNTGEVVQDISNLNWGTYYVTVTDDNGCEATSTLFVDFIDVINSLNEESNLFNVYPNPSNGNFRIESVKNVDINIYNAIGELVYKVNQNEISSEINLREMPSGIYIINVKFDNNKSVSKQLIIK